MAQKVLLQQPLKLQIEKEFIQASERVKSVDFHPTQPWILASLYSGTLWIWNYHSQTIEKSFKVSESPVRTAKFIARKNWIVCGSDDKFIRVFDYDSMESVNEFEAHEDYIRSVTVHPSFPFVLSSSDDKFLKLWDWEKGWECTRIFEGHSHYVMQAAFHPKDVNIFASASLDGTTKIWNLDSSVAKFTLDNAHSKGINCVDYFINNDKVHLITGSDDFLVKVWDYETKSCVQILEGHTNNVTAVCFHHLGIIITTSEDGTIRIWNATTFGLESTLNYGLERVWAIGYKDGSNQVVLGCDNGTVVIKLWP